VLRDTYRFAVRFITLRKNKHFSTIGIVPTIYNPQAKNPRGNQKPATPVSRSPMGPLTSYAVNPGGIRFETQDEEETVVLFLRQHMIVNLPWMILAVILLFAPTIIFPVVFSLTGFAFAIPSSYIIIVTAWWYIATAGFIIAKFLGWFINIYIVTNERIVDIDFYYLLYKHFSQAELNKIQDISYTTKGIFGTLFNFGDVKVETAGETPHLMFENIPHPEGVVEIIRKVTEKRGT
jgi:hypothetical protein